MVCNLGFKFPILSNFILSCEFFYQGGLQLIYPFEEIKHNFLVFIWIAQKGQISQSITQVVGPAIPMSCPSESAGVLPDGDKQKARGKGGACPSPSLAIGSAASDLPRRATRASALGLSCRDDKEGRLWCCVVVGILLNLSFPNPPVVVPCHTHIAKIKLWNWNTWG